MLSEKPWWTAVKSTRRDESARLGVISEDLQAEALRRGERRVVGCVCCREVCLRLEDSI